MQTRFCVRRGHSAAVYTSGHRSTSVGHQNKIFIRVSHTGAPVDTIGVSPFVKLAQNRKVFQLYKGKTKNSSAWNSAKTDNYTPLPSNVSYSYFCRQISVC
ncbi:hypothetical protein AB205_0103430 [Aquarana catesbeiana]|uniref:Uncharacterized protein n=1 Tax=Aquarana catesbeiana TaxID=8400 RepID=A0A2G9RWU8_AQUCT|nr:hypothetical protein AB205_0103430 [Aquarana catesbeiana]